jgi:undecaprenyl diphosphate synthase
MSLQDLLEVVPVGTDEEDLLRVIDFTRLPRHVAIIMDGNGRWARLRSKKRVEGHRAGIDAVRETVETAARLGLEVLTLYAFSIENRNNIRFRVVGRGDELAPDIREELVRAEQRTASATGLQFNIALNYGGRAEITDAVKRLFAELLKDGRSPEAIDEQALAAHLYTAGQPDPDLLIRTSGELRVSNFLLWQIAYSEIWVTDVLWPDSRRRHLLQAIADFQKRERRYGGIAPA